MVVWFDTRNDWQCGSSGHTQALRWCRCKSRSACLPWYSCSLEWPNWENVQVLHNQKNHYGSQKKTHDSFVLKWLGSIAFASGSWDSWKNIPKGKSNYHVQDLCVHLCTLRTYMYFFFTHSSYQLPIQVPAKLSNGHFDTQKPTSSTQVAAPNFHLYCLDLGKRRASHTYYIHCVYIYMNMCIYIYISTYIYIYAHLYRWSICIYDAMYICIYVNVDLYIWIYEYAYICI